MELTITYMLSQIFTVIMYILLATTYYLKDRKKILILNFLAIVANTVAYILLNAWTGLAMNIVALARNVIFVLDENKNGKRENITRADIIILTVLYMISVIFAVFTYNGLFSLFSVLATMLYTYSVWQKKTKVYKILGIPTCMLWISYNIYIMSIFGIILECVLLICSINGYVLEMKKRNK